MCAISLHARMRCGSYFYFYLLLDYVLYFLLSVDRLRNNFSLKIWGSAFTFWIAVGIWEAPTWRFCTASTILLTCSEINKQFKWRWASLLQCKLPCKRPLANFLLHWKRRNFIIFCWWDCLFHTMFIVFLIFIIYVERGDYDWPIALIVKVYCNIAIKRHIPCVSNLANIAASFIGIEFHNMISVDKLEREVKIIMCDGPFSQQIWIRYRLMLIV